MADTKMMFIPNVEKGTVAGLEGRYRFYDEQRRATRRSTPVADLEFHRTAQELAVMALAITFQEQYPELDRGFPYPLWFITAHEVAEGRNDHAAAVQNVAFARACFRARRGLRKAQAAWCAVVGVDPLRPTYPLVTDDQLQSMRVRFEQKRDLYKTHRELWDKLTDYAASVVSDDKNPNDDPLLTAWKSSPWLNAANLAETRAELKQRKAVLRAYRRLQKAQREMMAVANGLGVEDKELAEARPSLEDLARAYIEVKSTERDEARAHRLRRAYEVAYQVAHIHRAWYTRDQAVRVYKQAAARAAQVVGWMNDNPDIERGVTRLSREREALDITSIDSGHHLYWPGGYQATLTVDITLPIALLPLAGSLLPFLDLPVKPAPEAADQLWAVVPENGFEVAGEADRHVDIRLTYRQGDRSVQQNPYQDILEAETEAKRDSMELLWTARALVRAHLGMGRPTHVAITEAILGLYITEGTHDNQVS